MSSSMSSSMSKEANKVDLFSQSVDWSKSAPLADRMRPRSTANAVAAGTPARRRSILAAVRQYGRKRFLDGG